MRTAMRRVREAGSLEESLLRLREATALLSRAANRRLLHPNRAARLKSQLARLVDSRR